jgi:penicillin amidase
MDAEFAHYHPEGKAIITSFTEGINAYIKQVLQGEMPLPLEFQLLGIKPGYWTPAVVISRHNGWLTNVQDELATARLLNKIGEEKLRAITNFHPHSPDLHIDSSIDKERLNDDVLGLYNAFRNPLVFSPEDLVAGIKNAASTVADLSASVVVNKLYKQAEGSNNWVVSGKLAANGSPMLANDPHRLIATPSLRYIVHLSAPGWNVIGGGEPILPGVSIGHNEYGAWGLTIFETDAEDLYVYQLNPKNLSQYFYKGRWKSFEKITDSIKVKNAPTAAVSLYYSIHGPVTFIDSIHHIGYAVKCGWLQKGSAPYLASLRMNQAKNWTEFKAACAYSYIPAENMMWADKKGDIGWQTVGITPIRNKHSGMVPVPGDGRFEWSGYLPVLDKPSAFNPAKGFICSANENRTPPDYSYMNAIGYTWSDAYRFDRITAELGGNKKITMADMQALQMDYYSITASQLVPLLKPFKIDDSSFTKASAILQHWDFVMDTSSIAATVYAAWEQALGDNLLKKLQIETVHDLPVEFNTKKMIDLLINPTEILGKNPLPERDEILIQSLLDALNSIKEKLGADITGWKYGQANMKHILIKHPLSAIATASTQQLLNAGPIARGGNENTVNSTTSNLNQTHGASFRVIIDCADWDLMTATNTPGQSGDPASIHYKDLFELWGKNQYFPLYFSKNKILAVKEKQTLLLPK